MSKSSSLKKKPRKNLHTNIKKSVKKSSQDDGLKADSGVVLVIPSGLQLLKSSYGLMSRNKRVFIGVLAIYAILQIILVQGVLTSNFSELKSIFEESFGGFAGSLATLSYMVTNIGKASTAEAGVYQTLLFVIASLAIIWAVRHLHAGSKIRIRDAYYKGMYPLVPYFLVLIVIAIQMLPSLIGAWLYSIVIANGVASNLVEQGLWLGLFILLASLTVYMLCSSVFALLIVSLPDVAPIQALRSARKFVKKRRLQIIGRFVILILVLAVILGLVMVPVILLVPFMAPFIFHIITVMFIGFSITYIYHMYRGLIDNAQ